MKFWLVFCLGFAACTADATQASRSRDPNAKVRVVTTTTMLRDLVTQLGGEYVSVESLVGVGADPHVFQPKPSSARIITRSDLVITSGLGLEGWIDDLVKNAGGQRPVQVASRGITPIRMASFKAGVDPHFWFSPELWAMAATNVAAALDQQLTENPKAQTAVAMHLQRYVQTLQELRAWTQTQLGSIPKDQRVMITSHDAFNYFGRAFDLEVVGIQGLSTESEASQRDVARVIDLIRQRKIPAVFVESSVNPNLIQRVAKETGIRVLGPLFSDSLGDRNGPAETYVGMLVENVRMVTEGLGGRYQKFVLGAPVAHAK